MAVFSDLSRQLASDQKEVVVVVVAVVAVSTNRDLVGSVVMSDLAFFRGSVEEFWALMTEEVSQTKQRWLCSWLLLEASCVLSISMSSLSLMECSVGCPHRSLLLLLLLLCRHWI